MVVKSIRDPNPPQLDLPYLAFFLGRRVNDLVMARTIQAGFAGVRESHGYLIQHLIESDRTITELARRMEVTQQAASKTVAELIHLGILEAVSADDRRAKRIRLSQRGWSCVKLGRRLRQQVTRRLINAAGQQACDTAKSTLLTCLRALGGIERIRSRRIRAPR